MKKIRGKKLNFLLIIAAVLVVGIGVAYAALSTTLNITFGNVTQSAISWNVGFTGTTATATASGTSATGRVCGNATITSSAVTLAETTLSKPGDKCTYTLTVKNSGSVGATLNSITPTAPTSISCSTATGGNLVCGNITYKLTSDAAGANVLTTGNTLAANATQTIYLVAMYTGTGVQSSQVVHNGAKFTLSYIQA